MPQQPDPLIIGLCGRAGSGKTAAADYLEARYGFEPASFADALKSMLEQHLTDRGIDYAWLHEPPLKERPIPLVGCSARELMQRVGDCMRAIHPDYWVLALQDTLGLPLAPVHDRILVADVRYPNEASWLLGQPGARLLRLYRPSAAPVREHSSEQHADVLPATLDLFNDGHRLEHLHELLDGTMATWGIEPRGAA